MNKRSTFLQGAPVIAINDARAVAERFAECSGIQHHAPATWSAYESDWRIFSHWCTVVDQVALPATPDTVALFLAAQASGGYAPGTLMRRLSAIRFMHHQARLPSPHDSIQVATVLRGVFNARGQYRHRKKTAVDEEVHKMADVADVRTLQGLRDRAILLLGFASGLRRSELVALDVECVEERDEGLWVRFSRCKTGENSGGHVITILRLPGSRYCPVQALWAWRAAAHIGQGPLFRRVRKGDRLGEGRLTCHSVALAIKRLALRAGLNPAHYAGHSLRAGFLMSAARRFTSSRTDVEPPIRVRIGRIVEALWVGGDLAGRTDTSDEERDST